MKNKNLMIIGFSIFSLIFLTVFVSAYCSDSPTTPIWSVGSASVSPSEVSAGGSVTITVPITNNAQSTDYTCSITIGSASTSKSVLVSRTEYLTLQINAPTSAVTSQQTESVNINVECSGIWDRLWPLCDYEVYGQQTKSTTYKWPTQADIAEQQARIQAESAKTDASNAIGSANSDINIAESRINEASNTGADVSSATQSLNAAKSYLTQAENSFSSGNSAFSSQDYSSAKTSYNDAKNKANSAENSAAQAKSTVDQIMESYDKAKTEASNKVSDANSAIDTAKQRIQDADEVIADATVIGLDTAQSKADIATSRSKLKTAEDYYSEASNLFSSGNFEGAKSKAQSSISLADESESLATTAYNRLHERLTVSGESSKSILNANSEISQMNEILTKMDYIVRSTEKWGVDLTETKSVVDTSKTNVDSAEDLLSQAQNRLSSGSFDEAVNYANQARDKAASSRNRLDTMTQTISLSTQDALEKAYSELQNKVSLAEKEIISAQETYGATANLIVDAQSDLTEAKNNLAQVEGYIEKVKSASGLMSLLEEADATFQIIDIAQEKLESSLANSKSAKLGLAKKIGIGAAVVGGVVGGGFLYYRMRKKKKKKSEKGKKEEKSHDDKSKIAELKKKIKEHKKIIAEHKKQTKKKK